MGEGDYMMLKIAIVDDEQSSIDLLRSYLERFQQEQGCTFTLEVFLSAERMMERYQKEYDIIFLDIEMEKLDGINAAKQIREVDDKSILIFVTQMMQYAVQGYKVDALDFMVKPVAYHSFELVLRKALRKIKKDRSEKIVLQLKGSVLVMSQSQIDYVEVLDHYLTYHAECQAYTVKGTISEAERILDPALFFRCNRCYLVNVSKITEIKKGCILIGGQQIEVSRAKQKELLRTVAAYFGGTL